MGLNIVRPLHFTVSLSNDVRVKAAESTCFALADRNDKIRLVEPLKPVESCQGFTSLSSSASRNHRPT